MLVSEARDYNHAEELEICKHIIIEFTGDRDEEESCNKAGLKLRVRNKK